MIKITLGLGLGLGLGLRLELGLGYRDKPTLHIRCEPDVNVIRSP
jgi:hypothetical protein